jgi:hypothetical protein
MEGVALAIQWSTLPFVVETDSVEVASLIQSGAEDRSENAFLVMEIRRLLSAGDESKVEIISREQNLMSDALANLGRTDSTSNVWIRSGPRDIPRLCIEDCNVDG